jgi:hypothetical protein
MLLYQLYISLTNFVEQKTLIDLCAEINIFFYRNVKYLDLHNMIVDGVLYEIPKTFVQDFINYEASGFTKYN